MLGKLAIVRETGELVKVVAEIERDGYPRYSVRGGGPDAEIRRDAYGLGDLTPLEEAIERGAW